MKRFAIIIALNCMWHGAALAWGQEGHSIIAEVAQSRLSDDAAKRVAELLGKGRSLASIASWADDVRDERPLTANWHFVDIPISVPTYDAALDYCKQDIGKQSGFCVVKELEKLKTDLRCETESEKALEALKFAVHFLGDIHQPLHTVAELKGGNDVKVDIFMRGLTCTGTCEPTHIGSNFHAAWDQGLIDKVVWNWGAYVERLEAKDGWLHSAEAQSSHIDDGEPAQWALETHALAQDVWNSRPADNVLDDRYLRDVLPILDRQLGVAGLRLARFLNDAYAPGQCTQH